MERSRHAGVTRSALTLLVIALPLGVVAVIRALPPVEIATAGLGWVASVFAGALTVTAAIATVACIVQGLRHGPLAALFGAGAMAALAAGSLGMAFGAGPMTAAAAGAALLVLGACAADRIRLLIQGRSGRILITVAAMAAAGTVAVAELLPAPGAAVALVRPSLLAAGVVLGAIASLVALGRGLAPAAAAFTVGAAALLLSRGATPELLVGLAALTAATILITRDALDALDEHAETTGVARLPALAGQLSDGVLYFDGRLQLRDWNAAATQLLGLDYASAGTRLEDLLGVALAELPAGDEVVTRRTPVGGLELIIHQADGGLMVVIRDPGTSQDTERLGHELRGTIEELLQARRTVELQRAELERAVTIDALTGVSSRGALLDRLRVEVAQARRYQHPVALVLMDVDNFGALNRAHGIVAGDDILREVALRIRLRVREADALGRTASDGFIAVLPHTDETGAASFADALRRRLAQRPIRAGEVQEHVTVSVGVALMRAGEEIDVDDLIARAEEALASARGAGGNRIALDRAHGLARLEKRRPAAEPPSAKDETAQDSGG